MRRAVDTIGGLYQLARLAVLTRFRFRGPYWRWRMYTAIGSGSVRSRRDLARAVADYARWVHRMRRG